ncbi:MAG TPA: hypothetical protein PLE19_11445 [Planctomycetota bacterium]|nr:hypothetical protein [Planctomycetota bacterium]HRR81163.1 hypothetical protein [Planctomycetota bacterium]
MRQNPIAAWLVVTLAGAAGQAADIRLNRPEGLGYDAEGRLVVADSGNHRLLVFDAELEWLATFGAEGKEPGQFTRPTDVAFDSQGRLIVADAGNHRIQILGKDGRPLKVIGGPNEGDADGQFRNPSRVATDENDHILVTDTFNHRLQVFDREGKHVFTLANRTGPMPLELVKPDKEGKKTPKDWERTDPGQFNEPGGIFYDRELKRLFVANGWNCRCEVLDYDPATGEIKRRPEETGIVWGWWVTKGIAGDAQGRLLGCNTGFGNVLIFDNRAALTNKTPSSMTLTGGPYGQMRDLMDIAVAPNGDLALADAGNNRVVIFPPDLKLPGSPRATDLTRVGATILWETPQPMSPAILLRKSNTPERTPGHENLWQTGELFRVPSDGRPTTQHAIAIKGLDPGCRYYYRLSCTSLRSIPGGGYTREFAFATLPPKGKTMFLRIPVKVLLLPNIVNLDTVKPDTPLPPPMGREEIRLYRKAFAESQLFYWCNSSMRYWVDCDIYIDQTLYRTGKDRPDCPELMKLPRANHDESLKKLIAEERTEKVAYVGQVVCEAIRNWNEGAKRWDFAGSGGGTYGVEWPTPGRSHFLGGSDVAWLMTHEYKHQFESQYGNSGLDTEDDRDIFCHFSPQFPGWPWCTAYDHGEHWDGIAWQLRHLTQAQYFRNLYGEIVLANDADGDGIPDADPRVPLDEKHFGSSPRRADTDRDGLDDLGEILASRWVTALNADLRKRVPGKWHTPDPTNPDSDGDGIPDGKDKYPLYPFKPEIARGTIRVDGKLDDWGDKPDYWLDHEGIKLRGWARWDKDYLYYAWTIEGDWRRITLVVDQDADGFYVGGDNVYAEFTPGPDGVPQKANVRLHYCNLGRWPWFDDKHEFVKPEAYPFAASKKGAVAAFEVACPRNEMCGLSLQAGEEVGMALYIGLPDRGAISLFEPWSLFDSVLKE